jgi:hypothetical protein
LNLCSGFMDLSIVSSDTFVNTLVNSVGCDCSHCGLLDCGTRRSCGKIQRFEGICCLHLQGQSKEFEDALC